jgi:orotate phosphoribosyltransferase
MTTTPITNDPIARQAAHILLSTGAVAIRPGQPFTLTSGRSSPVYVDCRRLIGFVQERRVLTRLLVARMQAAGVARPDAVAGGETAGIPYAAWLAEAFDVPMLYVRKKPKGFGRGAQIEGFWHDGQNVLLAEDLATDGGSKIVFINALRRAGLEVRDCCVVFHYGIFSYEGSALASTGVRLHSLCTWADVLTLAQEMRLLPSEDLHAVREFLHRA